LEYHVSRTGVSSSPVIGRPITGNARPSELCSYPGDAATLVPLYHQTRGHNAGVHALAMDAIRTRPRRPERYPMTAPYQAYLLTKNPAYLAELRAQAQKYAQEQVDVPYTTSPGVVKLYQFAMAWTELLLAYE